MLESIESQKTLSKDISSISNKNNKKIKTINKNLFKDERIWTQNTKSYISNIIFDIKRDINFIQKARVLLDEIGEINNDEINKYYNEYRESKKQTQKKKIIKRKQPLISKKYVTMLKSVNNQFSRLKEESKEMQKINMKGLKHSATQYFRTSRPKSANNVIKQKYSKKIRPTSASTCYESKMFVPIKKKNIVNNTPKYKTLNFTHKSFRDGNNFKEVKLRLGSNNDEKKLMDLRYLNLEKMFKDSNKKPINFGHLNDIYRLQLNKGLNDYSPRRHMKDMKKCQYDDISVRQEIFDINKNIEEKVNERCKGFYFKKEYEKYMLKNKKNQVLNNSTHLKKNKNRISSFRLRSNYSSKNLFDPKSQYHFHENLNDEKREKISQKEKLEKKKENLREILEQLRGSLDLETIHNFIYNRVQSGKSRINQKDLIEMEKEYFPQLVDLKEKIKEIINDDEEEKISKEELELYLIKAGESLTKELSHNNNFLK